MVDMSGFASAKSDSVVPEKPTDKWQWCSEDEVDKLPGIRADVAYYAKRAIQEVQ